jgi:CRP-like cAMP-binding protein
MATNRILAALEPGLAVELASTGHGVSFLQGDLFCKAGDAIRDVFFPASGMISVVAELESGIGVEVAMLGSNSVLGGAALFGGDEHIAKAVGQIPGAGLLIPVSKVIEASVRSARLRGLVCRHEQFLLAQAQQTAACNGEHTIQQRLAGWLLRAAFATNRNELFVTQACLAQMLAVQRGSICVAACILAEAKTIDYRRGRITILDSEALGVQACACHRALAKRWGRLSEVKELSVAD